MALADWKEKAQQTFDGLKERFAQRAGNVLVAMALMDTDSIDQNEIWANALSAVTEGMSRVSLNQRQESMGTARSSPGFHQAGCAPG